RSVRAIEAAAHGAHAPRHSPFGRVRATGARRAVALTVDAGGRRRAGRRQRQRPHHAPALRRRLVGAYRRAPPERRDREVETPPPRADRRVTERKLTTARRAARGPRPGRSTPTATPR